jgi:hypothetical protein
MIINISLMFMLQSCTGILITMLIYAMILASVGFSSHSLEAKHYVTLTCLLVPMWAWIAGIYTINFY